MVLPKAKGNIFVFFLVQKDADIVRNIMSGKWKNITDVDFSATGGELFHLACRNVTVACDPVCMLQEKTAGIGKDNTAPFLFKQRDSKLTFKGGHRTAQGWLGNIKLLCRLVIIFQPGDLSEIENLIQCHVVFPPEKMVP